MIDCLTFLCFYAITAGVSCFISIFLELIKQSLEKK